MALGNQAVPLAANEQAVAPLTWEEHFKLGIQKYDLGQVEEALSHFEKADIESDHPEKIAFNRAKCHLLLNETEAAEKHLKSSLGSGEPSLDIKAQFQLGQLFFDQAFTVSANTQEPTLDLDKLKASSFAFQEVQSLGRRHERHLDSVDRELLAKAKQNVKNIAAKYKHHLDQESKERGKKSPIIQGSVKVNGRAVKGSKVFVKSKWEDKIYGHVQADEGGGFKFEDLPPGKYQLAPALFETQNIGDLKWGADIKVPTREKDVHDQSISGVLNLASPYQTNVPSLDAPYDDRLRDNGAASITKSTDWGELNDGFPVESLPSDNDLHRAYVAFQQPKVVLALAVPSQEQQEQAAQIQQSTEPSPPPTFKISLLGFHDGKEVSRPKSLKVFGMKEGLEQPMPLYESIVNSTDMGLYQYDTSEFAHQDCRNLIIEMETVRGQRMSLHEVEVRENLNKKDEQQDQQDQDQQQDQQDQNQQQDQQDQEQQDQQDQNQQQDQQQDQQQEPQESRSTRAILQQIKDKNEKAKEKNAASGIIISTDKDY
jgi:hypothetical protein